MKKIFFFFIFTIAFCFEAIAMDIPELAKYTLNSTVYIEVEYPYGPNGIGSGIVVNTKRDEGVDILTNYHVIKGAEKVLVKMNHIEWEAQIRGFNKDKDLALLVIMPSVDYPPISFAKTIPQHGDPILVAGAPMGMEQTISTGIVSGLREIGKELAYIQFTAPVSPGSSGGPLVNMNGEVVGMVTMALTQGQNMNFAIAFPILEDFVLSTHVNGPSDTFPEKSYVISLPNSKGFLNLKWGASVEDAKRSFKSYGLLEVDSNSIMETITFLAGMFTAFKSNTRVFVFLEFWHDMLYRVTIRPVGAGTSKSTPQENKNYFNIIKNELDSLIGRKGQDTRLDGKIHSCEWEFDKLHISVMYSTDFKSASKVRGRDFHNNFNFDFDYIPILEEQFLWRKEKFK